MQVGTGQPWCSSSSMVGLGTGTPEPRGAWGSSLGRASWGWGSLPPVSCAPVVAMLGGDDDANGCVLMADDEDAVAARSGVMWGDDTEGALAARLPAEAEEEADCGGALLGVESRSGDRSRSVAASRGGAKMKGNKGRSEAKGVWVGGARLQRL